MSQNIKKNKNFQSKRTINSGLKREKELLGLKNTQKLKTLNTVKMKQPGKMQLNFWKN